MAKANYRIRPKAQADLEDIWNYTYLTWGTRQARIYLEAIRDTCVELSINPKIGKARDEIRKGLYTYPSGKHLIFYFIQHKEIDIIRVLHENMDINYQFL